MTWIPEELYAERKRRYDKCVELLTAQGNGACINALLEDGFDKECEYTLLLEEIQQNL